MRRFHRDGGYSLVEIMVVMALLTLGITIFYTFMFGGERASRSGQEWVDSNQQARLALERLSRELREADQILSVSDPNGAWRITFQADLDGSGTFSNGSYIPSFSADEKITYTFDSVKDALMISTQAEPEPTVLADNIAWFRLSYFGSDPKLDQGCSGFSGPPIPGCNAQDGDIAWEEIDWSPAYTPPVFGFGNNDGKLNVELDHVSLIVVEMEMKLSTRRHAYRAGIELRNLFN